MNSHKQIYILTNLSYKTKMLYLRYFKLNQFKQAQIKLCEQTNLRFIQSVLQVGCWDLYRCKFISKACLSSFLSISLVWHVSLIARQLLESHICTLIEHQLREYWPLLLHTFKLEQLQQHWKPEITASSSFPLLFHME